MASLPSPASHTPFKKSWIVLLFLAVLSSAFPPSSPAEISYAGHCNSIVPESTLAASLVVPYDSFQLSSGYFSGGDQFLRQDHDPSSSSFSLPRSFYFHASSLRRTRTTGVLHIAGTLTLRGQGNRSLYRSVLTNHSRIGRPLKQRKVVIFNLSGFWSESAGKLCMVGPGFATSKAGTSVTLSALFKLNYPKISNISTSLVTGTVESLDAADSSNHFDPISVLAYAQKNYEYTQHSQAKDLCSRLDTHEEPLAIDFSNASCSSLQFYLSGMFKLEYGSDCAGEYCGPFARALGLSPSFMTISQIQCSENGNFHMYMSFPNFTTYAYNRILLPESSLVGEGFWDPKGDRLCLVACRILSMKDSLANTSVGDCTIGFSLWFPAVWSIKKRSTTIGRIWSSRKMKDSAYFHRVSFRSLESNADMLSGFKYEYTEMDAVRKSCTRSSASSSGKRRYPDGKSFNDLSFDITVRNTEGKSAWLLATPLSIGETIDNSYASISIGGSREISHTYSSAVASIAPMPGFGELNYSVWNVSYKIRYTNPNASLDEIQATEISAEGTYDPGTGVLCMVGCQYLSSPLLTKRVKGSDSMDCGIAINIQLAPLNPEAGEHLNGTIRSTRAKSNPFYFEPLEVSSYKMYTAQAAESVWRMDIEITMVLFSLTLSCILIGVQLFHVKKHPDVLPSVSILMLVILTLGHMIPLVLNFEALFFTNRNRQNVLWWSGGWLEVNEVVVRVMTMVAFLLQFRFLQVAWSARSAEAAKKGLWVAERKTLKLCLPLYIAGGFIAWFVHSRFHESQLQQPGFNVEHHHSLWEDLLSYAGLILDGFLVPQVILNIFWNSKDKALAPIYYIGTTAVRAMPHLYDAYRAHHYVPHLNTSYIYASPDGDFFSTAWDIIVPCEGVLFVVIIFLQQLFGGSCILPPRFRKPGGYETVSMVSL